MSTNFLPIKYPFAQAFRQNDCVVGSHMPHFIRLRWNGWCVFKIFEKSLKKAILFDLTNDLSKSLCVLHGFVAHLIEISSNTLLFEGVVFIQSIDSLFVV